jgi:hypothetical protein
VPHHKLPRKHPPESRKHPTRISLAVVPLLLTQVPHAACTPACAPTRRPAHSPRAHAHPATHRAVLLNTSSPHPVSSNNSHPNTISRLAASQNCANPRPADIRCQYQQSSFTPPTTPQECRRARSAILGERSVCPPERGFARSRKGAAFHPVPDNPPTPLRCRGRLARASIWQVGKHLSSHSPRSRHTNSHGESMSLIFPDTSGFRDLIAQALLPVQLYGLYQRSLVATRVPFVPEGPRIPSTRVGLAHSEIVKIIPAPAIPRYRKSKYSR